MLTKTTSRESQFLTRIFIQFLSDVCTVGEMTGAIEFLSQVADKFEQEFPVKRPREDNSNSGPGSGIIVTAIPGQQQEIAPNEFVFLEQTSDHQNSMDVREEEVLMEAEYQPVQAPPRKRPRSARLAKGWHLQFFYSFFVCFLDSNCMQVSEFWNFKVDFWSNNFESTRILSWEQLK